MSAVLDHRVRGGGDPTARRRASFGSFQGDSCIGLAGVDFLSFSFSLALSVFLTRTFRHLQK